MTYTIFLIIGIDRSVGDVQESVYAVYHDLDDIGGDIQDAINEGWVDVQLVTREVEVWHLYNTHK